MKGRFMLTTAALTLCVAVLVGCGDKKDENAEYYTLNKCDETEEELVEVKVTEEWSYDDEYSEEGKDMFLDHEDGGFIYICNEAYYPLYAYLVDGSIPTEEEFEDYECDTEVIGKAFDGSDCIYIEESYYDATTDTDYECKYLAMQYSDGGYIEYLVVDFFNMDTDDWSEDDYLELAQELFGK
ncbi:MAG: hypothetical protein ACI4DW_05275 [Lachnospiraceae bacterium]